ncbi:MAG: peroxide stress protein YaaA [candidate division Zixibacteria bacterium]|nr:peroxide stress protein YaaA [candidate division Zixibacteria bacterium]
MMRNILHTLVQNAPPLSGIPPNNNGILNGMAVLTPAYALYNGGFFKRAGSAIQNVVTGKLNNPGIHILIVSSFYGLIQINEGIKNYEMDLHDNGLPGVNTIGDYWHSQNIHNELANYVNNNSITNIWSLLSQPCHNLFKPYWNAHPPNIWCCQVFQDRAGRATAYRRGEWLDYLLRHNQGHLFNTYPLPSPQQVGNLVYDYRSC